MQWGVMVTFKPKCNAWAFGYTTVLSQSTGRAGRSKGSGKYELFASASFPRTLDIIPQTNGPLSPPKTLWCIVSVGLLYGTIFMSSSGLIAHSWESWLWSQWTLVARDMKHVSFDKLWGPFQPLFLPSFLQEENLQFPCPLQTEMPISDAENWANVTRLILRPPLRPSRTDCFSSLFPV